MSKKTPHEHLMNAAKNGNLWMLEQALDQGANPADEDFKAFYAVIRAKSVVCLDKLLGSTQPPVNTIRFVDFAAEIDSLDCLNILLKLNPGISCGKALRLAVGSSIECVERLIGLCDNKEKSAALYEAVSCAHADCVKFIIQATKLSEDDSRALNLAAEKDLDFPRTEKPLFKWTRNRLGCLRHFMEISPPAPLNYKRLFLVAIEKKQEDVVRIMLENKQAVRSQLVTWGAPEHAKSMGDLNLANWLNELIKSDAELDEISAIITNVGTALHPPSRRL